MAGTRAQSCDRYGSGTLHPGQILGGSLPLLSPAFRLSHFRRQVPVRSFRLSHSFIFFCFCYLSLYIRLTFCMRLFNFVNYVLLLLRFCILIDKITSYYSYVYVFLLLCLCTFIVMFVYSYCLCTFIVIFIHSYLYIYVLLFLYLGILIVMFVHFLLCIYIFIVMFMCYYYYVYVFYCCVGVFLFFCIYFLLRLCILIVMFCLFLLLCICIVIVTFMYFYFYVCHVVGILFSCVVQCTACV